MKSKYVFEKMELDGDIVAVPVGEKADELHAVLNLNEIAMRILEILQKETTIQEIVKQILAEYDCTEAEASEAVNEYIQELRKEGLLEE